MIILIHIDFEFKEFYCEMVWMEGVLHRLELL